MGLESGTNIDALVATNPTAGDSRSEGDDHLRLIKAALKGSFPGIAGQFRRTVTKSAGYTVLNTDNSVAFVCTAAITLALTAAATLGNGFHFWVFASGADIIVDPNASETIDGSATVVVADGEWAEFLCTGTAFKAIKPASAAEAAAGTSKSRVITPQRLKDALASMVYPVGSIYINAAVATNPGTLLGFGTWIAFGVGRCLVSLNSGNTLMDTPEETFGTADSVLPTHTHTVTDPGHNHALSPPNVYLRAAGGQVGSNSGSNWRYDDPVTMANTTGISLVASGVSPTNGNYQPSIAVYMWKRTA